MALIVTFMHEYAFTLGEVRQKQLVCLLGLEFCNELGRFLIGRKKEVCESTIKLRTVTCLD